MLNPLEYQFKNTLDKFGYDVMVNGTDQVRILLKEYQERTSSSEYKYMMFRNGLIKQGDIITLFEDNWLVLHEDISINDVYTKVIIRRLKFNISFNFNGDVKAFPSAIDEGAYKIIDDVITLPDGRIVLYMQENTLSKQIVNTQRFIVMGNPWKVAQKTNAEHGLFKIYADIDIFNEDDDIENEIADRWKYEIKPIDIISVAPLTDIIVDNGTLIEDITLPTTALVTLKDSTTRELQVTWNTTTYNGDVAATYNLIGTITVAEGITNTKNIKAKVNIIVEEQTSSATYSYTTEQPYPNDPDNEIFWEDTYIYTILKYVGGVEVTGNFTFALTDTNVASISNYTSNTVSVTATMQKYGFTTLIVTDVDAGEIAIEKEIEIYGM